MQILLTSDVDARRIPMRHFQSAMLGPNKPPQRLPLLSRQSCRFSLPLFSSAKRQDKSRLGRQECLRSRRGNGDVVHLSFHSDLHVGTDPITRQDLRRRRVLAGGRARGTAFHRPAALDQPAQRSLAARLDRRIGPFQNAARIERRRAVSGGAAGGSAGASGGISQRRPRAKSGN